MLSHVLAAVKLPHGAFFVKCYLYQMSPLSQENSHRSKPQTIRAAAI